jgi:hypothetical protein
MKGPKLVKGCYRSLHPKQVDISSLDFPTMALESDDYYPSPGTKLLPIAKCILPSTPTIFSHLRVAVEVQFLEITDEGAKRVLSSLGHLEAYSDGKCMAAKELLQAASGLELPKAYYAQIPS